jgi:hypothetical protein
MSSQMPVQAVIGVSGFYSESGGIGVTGERFVRVDLPTHVTAEHVAMMQRDFGMIAEYAQRYPDDLVDLHNAVVRHDFGRAGEVARRIGLTEEAMVARGGGQVGIALGITAALVVYALVINASEGSGEPAQPQPQPLPDLDGGLPPGGAPQPPAPTE